jgi:hypothetical protein
VGIADELFGYLIRRLIGEGSGEDEDDLVRGGSVPLKDVLQHACEPHSRERLPDLLEELAVERVQRVLAEFDVTAERTVKPRSGRVSVLTHEQRAVARAPDHRHCLDDLAPGAAGFHGDVVSRPCASEASIEEVAVDRDWGCPNDHCHDQEPLPRSKTIAAIKAATQWWWPCRPSDDTGVAPGRVHCGTGRLVSQVGFPSASLRQNQPERCPLGQPSGLSSHVSPRP